jgi:hypothetical protein
MMGLYNWKAWVETIEMIIKSFKWLWQILLENIPMFILSKKNVNYNFYICLHHGCKKCQLHLILPIKFQTFKIPRTFMNLLWVENLKLKMVPFVHGVGETLEGGACTNTIGTYKWVLFGKWISLIFRGCCRKYMLNLFSWTFNFYNWLVYKVK